MTEIILTSSALILFLIIIRKLLRGRISPTVQYALWLLVAARLLIPGTLFTTPVSLMGSARPLLTAIEDSLFPEDALPPVSDTYTPAAPETIPPSAVTDDGDTIITTYPPQATAPVAAETVNWAAEIWKCGAIVMGSVLLLSNAAFYVDLRGKRRLIAADDLPHPCPIRVYSVPGLTSPCLFGLARPAIYLNEGALAAEGLNHILTHEETHYRHGDHIWAILRCICLAVHWYNPLVWWAAVLSRRDCELSCDAGAIRRLGEENRISYGRTLLNMITPGRRASHLFRTATTMSDGKRTMTERIRLIAKQPKMLKITLAALVLVMCGAVAVTFGGAAVDAAPEDNTDIQDTQDAFAPDTLETEPSGAKTTLTEEQALTLYQQAREIWTWFELGTLPTTDAALQDENGNLLRVADYDSLTELRSYLEQYFSSSLVEYLLTSFTTFKESNGGLYVLPAGRGSNIYAGEETVTAFLLTGANAAQQGYDCHIYATTEVLDEDMSTVLYQKRHDWYIAWNGKNYVFTTFGPHDDVDPQKYYNALSVLEHYESSTPVSDWLPLLAYFNWNALYATRDQWSEGSDRCMDVLVAISEYITGDYPAPTAAQAQHILSATEGLDGAYSEQYQFIVYELYQKAPSAFAYAVLESLEGSYQTQIIDYLRYEEQYHRAPSAGSTPMTHEETVEMLRQVMYNAVTASPIEMTFDRPGQREQLLPVNSYGISVASFSSSDPSVATVDGEGFVTAVSPGTTTITLHYEGAAGQKDLTCAVSCEWEEEPVSEELPRYNGMDRGEIILEWQRSLFGLVFATPACPGGELYFDDAEDGALRENILRCLEESAREHLGDEFDSIQLLEEIVTPEDQGYPWEITVTYQVIAKRTNTFPNGETYTLTQNSEPLTTTFQAAGNHFVMNMIRFEGMDLMDDCQLPDTNLMLQEPWTLEHISEDIQTRTNAHLQTIEGRSGLTVTDVVLEKELVIPENIYSGDTIKVSYNLYLQGVSDYEPTSLGVFSVTYTFSGDTTAE